MEWMDGMDARCDAASKPNGDGERNENKNAFVILGGRCCDDATAADASSAVSASANETNGS